MKLQKELLKKRDELRKKLKGLLEQKQELTQSSEFYAGLKKTKGRISWKGVAEELAGKYDMGEDELEAVLDDYRSDGKRLKYERRSSSEDKKLAQMEFEFMTPDLH